MTTHHRRSQHAGGLANAAARRPVQPRATAVAQPRAPSLALASRSGAPRVRQLPQTSRMRGEPINWPRGPVGRAVRSRRTAGTEPGLSPSERPAKNPKTTCDQRPHAASASDGRFAPSDAVITRWRSAPAADRGEAYTKRLPSELAPLPSVKEMGRTGASGGPQRRPRRGRAPGCQIRQPRARSGHEATPDPTPIGPAGTKASD